MTFKNTTIGYSNTTIMRHDTSRMTDFRPKDGNDSILPICTFYVHKKSVQYFQSRLEMMEPHFVEFGLDFGNNVKITYTDDVFRGRRWFWTFASAHGNHPYLSWNIDYGILSFNLLYAKTKEIRYVLLLANYSECEARLGTRNTTENIVEAFKELVNISNGAYHKYEESYFCYLAKQPGCNESVAYQFALYLDFPVAYINYNCCQIKYFYENSSFSHSCFDKQVEKWSQCILVPFLMGLVVFLYFPILLFNFGAVVAEGEKLAGNDYDELRDLVPETLDADRFEMDDENWVFLDGRPPVTLLDSLRFLFCEVSKKHPITVSRIRRFIILLLGPTIIYVQLYMYKDGMGVSTRYKTTVEDLVRAGTPLGFLALLGDANHASKGFVPVLGGPKCLLIMYYILGLILFVMPSSVKQLVENGIPKNVNAKCCSKYPKTRRQMLISPFCFSFSDITYMAMVEPTKDRGYKKGACLFKCSFYMLFTRLFWGKLWEIQVFRFSSVFGQRSKIQILVASVLFPLLIACSLLESLLCIAFYAIPFFSFILIMVKGVVLGFNNSRARQIHPALIAVGTAVIVILYVWFLYTICLIFIESFSFVSQIIMFCFIAVIVYPSLSFGYLFFFIVLLYYLFRLFRDFGDGYLELLSTAVERSVDLEYNVNYVSVYNSQLVVSNVRVHPIHSIKINNVTIDVPQNTLQTIQHNSLNSGKIKQRRNTYGIPKTLFNFLVHKYRPMHIQFLRLLLHFGLIILLIIVTMSITSKFVSGPTSELSDVMHVIFLVTVGALPRVLEVAMVNESKVVKKEIQNRNIEQSILQYWESQSSVEDLD